MITIGGISRATAYNFLAGKQDMTFKIAAAVNKLIPEISIEFLLNYQVKYTCYIKKFENSNNIDNAKDLISFFCLDKLYPELKNKMKAKTGSMSGVRALAGYLTAADGTQLAFTIIVNHYTCTVSQLQKAIGKFLSFFI